jgi:signal transduction histidine kinase
MTTLQNDLKSFERKQITVSILALIGFLGASLVFNYIAMNSRAEQTAKLISRMIQTEDFREVGNTLQLARLDYFTKIQYVSDDPRKSFTLPAVAEVSGHPSLWHLATYDKKIVNVNELVISNPGDKIVFEFSRLSLMPWAFLFWFILNIVSIPQTRLQKKRIVKQYQKDIAIQKDVAHAEIAKKVRHNIRTPLSALLRLSSKTTDMATDQRDLFQSIITQIRTLISEMDPHREASEAQTGTESVWNTLRQAVNENRLAIPEGISLSSRLEDSIVSARVKFTPHELRSVVANLVMNAAEALGGNGKVELTARDSGSSVVVEVSDNGPGISAELISKVIGKGFTSGKSGGTGLGLHHANECVKLWGGHLQIKSAPGNTSVSLTLPIVDREPWFVPRLKFSQEDRVVVIDDQVSFHRLWKMRLAEVGFCGKLHTFFSRDEATEFLAHNEVRGNTHYFVDYDLGENSSGLQYLNELSNQKNRYLVTGSFDEVEIQCDCIRQGIGLIPKPELSELPIVI